MTEHSVIGYSKPLAAHSFAFFFFSFFFRLVILPLVLDLICMSEISSYSFTIQFSDVNFRNSFLFKKLVLASRNSREEVWRI
jgi:hypothetical protein